MRSEQHMQGYSAAWKDAIEWLHRRAEAMNDPHAKVVLNAAAFSLGAGRASHVTIQKEKTP